MEPIYLDHNATTPLLPEVAEAMARAQRDAFANPSSQHALGRRGRRILEDARERLTLLLGGQPAGPRADRLVFTSGGTEANNLALFGLAGPPGTLLLAPLEHPSVLRPAQALAAKGWQLAELAVSPAGTAIPASADPHLGPSTRLACLLLASHETGALQPVAELAARCAAAGVPVHTDAVQAVGKVACDFRALGVATLSLAAHKFHGPRGIGGLLIRHDVQLAPMLWGGFQQGGLRAGTEPVALAVGMCTALELAHQQAADRRVRLAQLRDRLESRLRAHWPELVVLAESAPRLPHVSCFALPGLDRQALAMALDLAGVCVATGSACASGSSQPSAAVAAMGCSEAVIQAAIRCSLGVGTTLAEVDLAVDRILQCANHLRSLPAAGNFAATARSPAVEPL